LRIIDAFDRGADTYPHRSCLIDRDIDLTYREVQATSHAIALALRDMGFAPGTKAALFSPNSARSLECLLGMLRAGFVWIPLNARAAPPELIHVINLTECEIVLYDAEFESAVEGLKASCAGVRSFLCIKDPSDSFGTQLSPYHGHLYPELTEDPEGLIAIFTSGGTTGLPKGVVWPPRIFETMLANFWAALPKRSPPVHLAAAPLTHAAGAIALMLFAEGATQVILPAADPLSVMQAIDRHRVTHVFLPPTVIYMMIAHAEVHNFDYSSLDYFIYSAAPMSVDKLREALAIFGPVMVQMFGQVEAPMCCTVLTAEDHRLALADERLSHRLASCGRPMLLTRVEIMDEAGALLERGERGEIVLKGNLVTPGYYKNAEATDAAKSGGWHRTGDVGYRDSDGYLYIVDRTKDMIITGGFNVYPSEIEQVIWAHEAVQDCAVIGVPDEKWGEAVKAVIELKSGKSASEAEIIALCKARLGSVKTPKTVEFWESMPRTPVGKVRKADIRETFWSGGDRRI